MAQGMWAMANHEIGYKSPIDVPDELRRRLTKMTVFMETFDEEVKRIRDEVMDDDAYPLARLLSELDAQRARIGRPPCRSSTNLTRRMVERLLGEKDPVTAAENLRSWMDRNEEYVAEVISRYDGAGRQFYVDRPEGLLAFFLISTDKYGLADRWRESGDDPKVLEDLFIAWGAIVPAPDAL